MKLTRPPRLFGSSTTTTVDKDTGCKEVSPIAAESNSSIQQTSSIKNKFRKSPLLLLKDKLSSLSSNNVSSPPITVTDPEQTRRKSNKESSKLSSETTSRENSRVEEEEEEDPKKCLDFAVVDENKSSEDRAEDGKVSVVTQNEALDKPSSLDRDMAKPPKSLFRPPKEVMIDPHAVPPSPMKDPVNMYAQTARSQEPHSLLLNLGNSELPAGSTYHLGDPVGDIAMKRQILDAQRLVRIILGKPSSGDQHFLETTTILQAIRAFALMKQELVELRKKQEVVDGDPPTILQELASPVGTNTSDARTATTQSPDAFSFRGNSSTTRDESSSDLEEANNKIGILEQQLDAAHDIIHKVGVSQESSTSESGDRQDDKFLDLNAKYQKLLHNHEAAVEESRRNLDAVIESVASVPKRVLAKGSVREKLRAYCTAVSNHATQLQIMELEANMQREREESQRRLAELEERLRTQEEAHQRELELLRKGVSALATAQSAFPKNSIPELEEEKKVDV
ncbi:hypothetical protein IV203_029629 [Nitzschia inconspicua]|uniref:Uncharacterized protein n=1 Tax=Nitzschia inconspicua TaxID=303405 RepID=A0A9K3Q3G0_9STRA|nr:hypothetical protein IV203_029629 [Nitzschia inconspicua]